MGDVVPQWIEGLGLVCTLVSWRVEEVEVHLSQAAHALQSLIMELLPAADGADELFFGDVRQCGLQSG